MSYEQNRFTDDITRPADANGNPIAATLPQVYIRGLEDYYDHSSDTGKYCSWACTMHCDWYSGESSPNPVLSIGCYFLTSDANSFYPLIRVKVEISDDNFKTIRSTTYMGASTSDPRYPCLYMTAASGLTYSSRKNYEKKGVYSCARYGWLSTKISLSGIAGKEYKLRLQTQTRRYTDSSWSNTGSARVYSSYVPFYFDIVKPEYFYSNRVNTFGASIGAQYISKITGYIGSNEDSKASSIGPVRTESAPYITTGQSTNNIYWARGRKRGSAEPGEPDGTTYKLKCVLEVIDPSDSNFTLKVCETSVSGDCYWHETDDLSMLDTEVTFEDLSGYYDTYGYLLRNTDTTVRASINLILKYGIIATLRYKKFSDTVLKTDIYYGSEANTFDVDQFLPETGSPITTTVELYNQVLGVIKTDTFSAPVIDYGSPSFQNLAIHRCDASGAPNDGGDHCRIEWSVSIVPIANQNSKKLEIVHPEGTTTYDPLSSYTQTGVMIVAASTERAYTLTFTVSDDLRSYTRTLRLSTALTTMDLLYKGRGVSFGKVAEQQYAVEISPDWKLICYQLFLSGINFTSWMNEMDVRMKGLERYTSNIYNSGQFQVSFYNDKVLVERQWIRNGENAQEPGLVPERESTKQYSYSFAGWAKTENAAAADSDALSNITDYRTLYAVYVSTLRTYRVEFYNGDTMLERLEDVQYGTSAASSAETPTGDGTFFGYLPNPTFVESNMECYAQFYNRSEITDDWDAIIEKCYRKTAGDEYKVGQYKPIKLTNGKTINMRLMGIRKDTISGLNKAELSWIAESVDIGVNAVPFNLSSDKVPVYHEPYGDVFTAYRVVNNTGTTSRYQIKMPGSFIGTSKVKFRVSRLTAGNFEINCYSASTTSCKLTVDGTVVWDYHGVTNPQGSSNAGTFTHTGTKQAGEYNEFELEYSFVEGAYVYDRPYNSISIVEDGAKIDFDNTYIVSEDRGKLRKIHHYENGFGGVGGWEYSNLRSVMQNDVLPLIPENIRENIKTVKKASRAWISTVEKDDSNQDATISPQAVITSDAIWAPSRQEILGAAGGDLSGEAEYGFAGSNVPANELYKWTRDQSETGETKAIGTYGSKVQDTTASWNEPIWIGFCT